MRDGHRLPRVVPPGERHLETCYDRGWLQGEALELEPWIEHLEAFARFGQFELNPPGDNPMLIPKVIDIHPFDGSKWPPG